MDGGSPGSGGTLGGGEADVDVGGGEESSSLPMRELTSKGSLGLEGALLSVSSLP